jgi:MarR family transcriptional regulator, transcriptional regulator for hemolysin
MEKHRPFDVGMPLWLQLNKVAKQYMDVLADRLGHLGIQRHFYILLVIGAEKSQATQQYLADVLEVDKVTMVSTLDYLSERGFVERKVHPTDGRKHRIALTPKAKKALPEIRKTIGDLNRLAFSALPKTLSETFPEALVLMRKVLENAGGPDQAVPPAAAPKRGNAGTRS